MTTDRTEPAQRMSSSWRAIIWKTWHESRARFFSALVLLVALVFYAVFTSKGYLGRYNSRHPEEPLRYSVYVWSGLFSYALQGLWILAAFILGLGGLARERATGVASFTLGLPVPRTRFFLVRVAIVSVEAIVLAVVPALLIPVFSAFVGQAYPQVQALTFGLLMSIGGLVFLALGLLLSELFEAEFTAPVIGLCTIVTIFLSNKAHTLHRWNVFDAMSGAQDINPSTQFLVGTGLSGSLYACVLAALGLIYISTALVRTRDF